MFYNAVKKLKDREDKLKWDIKSMFPTLNEHQIGEKVVDYYNAISEEFVPLKEESFVATTNDIVLERHEVSKRIKEAKKPRSRVDGDIFIEHLGEYSDLLAIPITEIYNTVLNTQIWPASWKVETVVVIPKKACSASLSECRNLSCTQFFSKTLERVVFERICQETKLSPSQYGGQKGCGVEHMLIDAWTNIINDLETHKMCSNIVSLDFGACGVYYCLKKSRSNGTHLQYCHEFSNEAADAVTSRNHSIRTTAHVWRKSKLVCSL